MKKGIAVIIGLGVLIIALAFVLLLVPASKPGNLQTYVNASGGFSLQYPAGATVREGDPQGFYIDPETGNATTIVSIVFPRVDTFSENSSHGYYQYQVRVMVTPLARYACTRGGDVTPTVTTGGDAAAGNRLNWTLYGYCHGGKLYSVYDMFASGSDGTPLTPKLEADIAAGKVINEQIAKSFKFAATAPQ